MAQTITLNEMQLIAFGNEEVIGDGDTLREGANKINNNFTELYTKLNGFSVSGVDFATPLTEGIVKYDNETIVKNLDGQLTVQFPAVPTVDSIPIGLIAMWSGLPENIPTGWALCDGTNGTPDLRGRFIVGYKPADSVYSPIGSVGGRAHANVMSHQHSFSTNFTTPPHSHSITDPGHFHSFFEYRNDANDDGAGVDSSNVAQGGNINSSTSTTGIVSTNPFTLTGTIVGSTDVTGETDPNNTNNLPPYYVLAFIIKT